jgi:hypothetical protein
VQAVGRPGYRRHSRPVSCIATPSRSSRAVAGQSKPTRVVFLGDIADQHALSRFTRDPSGLSAGHELRAARRQLAPLYDLFPVASVCWGNHDRRLYDRAAEVGIPD